MNMSQLKPAWQVAQKFGVKCLTYGLPGTGKTPIMGTAPRPVALIVEPGMLSMQKENPLTKNLQCWQATDVKSVNEFFTWAFQSAETKNFDTICVDSVSQMAEMFLTAELPLHNDPRQAFGQLSKKVMGILEGLFYLQNKHIYLIAKQETVELCKVSTKRPYFPGKDLNIKVPHLYDEVFHIGKYRVPGQTAETGAIRTSQAFDTVARDRSGNLAELEFPHLGQIFAKCMS